MLSTQTLHLQISYVLNTLCALHPNGVFLKRFALVRVVPNYLNLWWSPFPSGAFLFLIVLIVYRFDTG